MTSFLAAAIQMNSQPDLERNMELVGVDAARAAREGARFIALPENFAYLGSELGKHRQADRIAEAVLEQIPALARELGVYLLAGGFPVRTEPTEPTYPVGRMVARESGNPRSRVYNRAIVADPSGSIIAQYDKIHLFDITLSDVEKYRESSLVAPGLPEAVVCDMNMYENESEKDGQSKKMQGGATSENPQSSATSENPQSNATSNNAQGNIESGDKQSDVASTWSQTDPDDDKDGIVRLGLSICYDVRFPELYRHLSAQGAQVLCVPSAFTRPTGAAHWETLLRARAIENTCYVIAPAQTGTHGKKRTTHGHSLIIDPWGTVLSDAQKKPGVIYAEIDTGLLKVVREKLPSLRHRRL